MRETVIKFFNQSAMLEKLVIFSAGMLMGMVGLYFATEYERKRRNRVEGLLFDRIFDIELHAMCLQEVMDAEVFEEVPDEKKKKEPTYCKEIDKTKKKQSVFKYNKNNEHNDHIVDIFYGNVVSIRLAAMEALRILKDEEGFEIPTGPEPTPGMPTSQRDMLNRVITELN